MLIWLLLIARPPYRLRACTREKLDHPGRVGTVVARTDKPAGTIWRTRCLPVPLSLSHSHIYTIDSGCLCSRLTAFRNAILRAVIIYVYRMYNYDKSDRDYFNIGAILFNFSKSSYISADLVRCAVTSHEIYVHVP